MTWRPDHLAVSVTYRPAATGPYMWHEPTPVRAAADLAAIRAAGFESVRLHLAWDAFMPSDRQVDRYRLRDLEALLQAAREVSLEVVPVLFCQAFGDTIMLPRYAVDRRRPRPGVRVVTDTNVVSGGPRDPWVDPLMLEVETRWLDTLLDAFANHPAIAAWDLGHDPAAVARPRRIAHLEQWTALMAGRVRERQDACLLTLVQDDVLTARGVRLGAVAPHVDGLGLVLEPQRLSRFAGDAADVRPAVLVAQLALRLAAASGPAPPLLAVIGVASGDEAAPPAAPDLGDDAAPAWEIPPLSSPLAARHGADLLDRLAAVGVSGVCASAWCDLGVRLLTAPPCDRRPSLARHGLATTDGSLKPVGEAWSAIARREPSLSAADPWPDRLDVEDYYAHLRESALDLWAGWLREREGEA